MSLKRSVTCSSEFIHGQHARKLGESIHTTKSLNVHFGDATWVQHSGRRSGIVSLNRTNLF